MEGTIFYFLLIGLFSCTGNECFDQSGQYEENVRLRTAAVRFNGEKVQYKVSTEVDSSHKFGLIVSPFLRRIAHSRQFNYLFGMHAFASQPSPNAVLPHFLSIQIKASDTLVNDSKIYLPQQSLNELFRAGSYKGMRINNFLDSINQLHQEQQLPEFGFYLSEKSNH